MNRYLLKGGMIVTPDSTKNLDLLVVGDFIEKIGHDLNVDGAELIDCRGKLILPGVIDPHVHFRDPGFLEKEDWASGSLAAVKGGVTTVFDMPNTNPATTSREALALKLDAAKAKSLCNFGVFAGATPTNNDELLAMKEDVIGIKIYMGSSTGDLLVDRLEALKQIFDFKMQIVVHAESERLINENMEKFREVHDPAIHSVIRNNEVAAAATQMAIELGEAKNVRLHIAHMSTKEELLLVKNAKRRGYSNLSCEVCPHHLYFNTDDYLKFGNYLRVNPPIRSADDVAALWFDGIGLYGVDMVATDHAPHLPETKEVDYWQAHSGMPGVQESLPLMLTAVSEGRLTINRLVELMSFNPAKIFGVAKRGLVTEGNFADLAIVDPHDEYVYTKDMVATKCGWSNYVGRKFVGKVVYTFVNGNLVFDRGSVNYGTHGSQIRPAF